MDTPVSTSTLEAFLDTIFQNGFDTAIYALSIAWPYLLAVGLLYFFWRIAKSVFHF